MKRLEFLFTEGEAAKADYIKNSGNRIYYVEKIFELQGNRNPFIDFPDMAKQMIGG